MFRICVRVSVSFIVRVRVMFRINVRLRSWISVQYMVRVIISV